MEREDLLFRFENLKEIHVGDLPSAKKGIIDSLLGEDKHKDTVPDKQLNSYIKGHQIGTYIENALKADQSYNINQKRT
ncbi:hypothetical protein SH2C18_43120 [Clostridium sediminicola]|uniref:hypothetical protein n=1 Tax=Clostridium sediminicola TaxID=3114879 RepID=UPI0031F1D9A0